jgi:hypothetical protein
MDGAARSANPAPGAEEHERGFVVIWMAIVLFLLLAIAALAVDLVHAYAEAQHLQNAVDAAALAGAAELPSNVGSTMMSVSDARDVLSKNGFDPSGKDNSLKINQRDNTVSNQWDVEMTHTFPTMFGGILGFDTITVHKHANAQYDAPLAMGSPSNNLGRVPRTSCIQFGFAATDPEGCVSIAANGDQPLWLQIQGQSTFKSSGNAFTTTGCGGAFATDGCDPNTNANTDYDPAHPGEYFSIVNDDPNQPLYIYVYDASFIDTRDNGLNPTLPCGKQFDVASTPAHYADPGTPWCAGDQNQNGQAGGGGVPPDTQYEMLEPDSTPSPFDNPPISGDSSIDKTNCRTQDLPGDNPPIVNGVATLTDPTESTYFEKWWQFCELPASSSTKNEWILHVTSNNPNGQGSNQFAVLALHTPLGAVSPSSPPLGLQVFSRERLPVFATADLNASPTATFYLAKVLPSPERDRTLEVSFFDLGDNPPNSAPSTGTLTVIAHNASFGATTYPMLCTWAEPPGFSTTTPYAPWGQMASTVNKDCTFHYDKSTWNGQWVTVDVPVPKSYTCPQISVDDCWIQLVERPDATANPNLADATTWTARMAGSPVRLVG